ncbi:hypothetical protein OG604_23990 [Streptomyces sp. NBC_01231]|nr:hypothetical protein OG604_23990 [Streptomyces sp. NBC_01231]
MNFAGIEVDAVRGTPEGVTAQPLETGLFLALVGGEVGADEGVEAPSMGVYQGRTVGAIFACE